MKRKQVLDAAALCVTHDRNDTYGGPEDSFAIIADLWSVYWQATDRINFEAHDVALMLALLKTARLVRNPKHADSWVDLAGYAACGAECAQGTQGPGEPAPGTIKVLEPDETAAHFRTVFDKVNR